MRVLTLVGARPQFVKAAPVSRALSAAHEERLVHSGQHWDVELSKWFFDELGLPQPAAHLGAEHLAPAPRLTHILRGLRSEIRSWNPDIVVLYGDTDTTLAGALAARVEGVPIAHIEAGMRSGEPRMPEEINRIAVDHSAQLLLAPTARAAQRLRAERVSGQVDVVGDVMLDAVLDVDVGDGLEAAQRHGCRPGGYLVATIHRAENVNDSERLATLVRTLDDLDIEVLMPLHPRTQAAMSALPWADGLPRVRGIPPLGRGEMLRLLRGAKGVLTDSGGVQREAWFLGVPCATLRERTEWTETLEGGWNRLVGADPGLIRAAVAAFDDDRADRDLDVFGGGHAAERVVLSLEAWMERR